MALPFSANAAVASDTAVDSTGFFASGEYNFDDVDVLLEDETGTYYIALVDTFESAAENAISRADGVTRYKSSLFLVWRETLFGDDEIVMEISARCTWIDRGVDSYIETLHCSVDKCKSGYSYEWNDDYMISTVDWHQLALDITHLWTTHTLICQVGLVADREPTVVFHWSMI